MADAVDPTNDPDGSKPDADALAAELTSLKKQLAQQAAELEAERGRKTKAVEDAKAEREKRKKEAEEKGEFDKVKAELEKQITELDGKVKELAGLEDYRAKWTEHEEKRRAELIAKLPEDKRDAYKARPLDVLEDAVSLLGEFKGVDTDAARRGNKPNTETAKWRELTREQQDEWRDAHKTPVDRDASRALAERLKNESRK